MSAFEHDTIAVQENGQLIHFSFADLLKYHGYGYPGGVAHAFKVLQRALPLVDGGQPPQRAELSMDTAFPGPGARDGFEMVTRMVSGGRYRVDPALAGDEVIKSASGGYFFRLKYRQCRVDLRLRPGFVVDEFLSLSRQALRTPAEEERLTWLKQDLAQRLLGTPAAEVYDAVLYQSLAAELPLPGSNNPINC